jgi:hypothetical protein
MNKTKIMNVFILMFVGTDCKPPRPASLSVVGVRGARGARSEREEERKRHGVSRQKKIRLNFFFRACLAYYYDGTGNTKRRTEKSEFLLL